MVHEGKNSKSTNSCSKNEMRDGPVRHQKKRSEGQSGQASEETK